MGEAAGHFSISEGTVRRWVAFYHHTVNCEDCGAVFAYEKELKKHQVMKHSEKYRYSTYDVQQPQKKTHELEVKDEDGKEAFFLEAREGCSDDNEEYTEDG